MLPNNVEFDQETKLIEDGVSQTGIAEKLGVTVSNGIVNAKKFCVYYIRVKPFCSPLTGQPQNMAI